ncbi:Hypothetical predicted protein [Olea europaea subsp. europaea]|uniref:Uncharacterized protein n=1 Tax=Olea europaea subsp. europaea TaxID=158383 RepID=A0A8S0R7R5_OLEEU|nr:Hypothetical predicted protein [Olea europaea subsp. europaea]
MSTHDYLTLCLLFLRKQGVQSFNAFDFLKEVISMVPVLGGSDATVEDTFVAKRSKISEDEDGNDNE